MTHKDHTVTTVSIRHYLQEQHAFQYYLSSLNFIYIFTCETTVRGTEWRWALFLGFLEGLTGRYWRKTNIMTGLQCMRQEFQCSGLQLKTELVQRGLHLGDFSGIVNEHPAQFASSVPGLTELSLKRFCFKKFINQTWIQDQVIQLLRSSSDIIEYF